MTQLPGHPNSSTNLERWASLRFAIIGQLLSDPPGRGELKARLESLSSRTWQHPTRPGEMLRFGYSTLERWYYSAKCANNPIEALRRDVRKDNGIHRTLSEDLKQAIRSQYSLHADWTVQLHHANISALIKEKHDLEPRPSYSSLRRFMKSEGLHRIKRKGNARTPGAIKAQERRERREVRSFEVDHIGGLWHLDFHTSRVIGVIKSNGDWVKPHLLGMMDDRSRLCCHAQFYLSETTEDLVHGFSQAILKRGLPRRLLTDNGGPMISAEFTQGLERLSIIHETTLPYSPYQNGKQEHFWAVVESRLMSMLSEKKDLTLSELNHCLQAWLEGDYHKRTHSETKQNPKDRFHQGPSVMRESPAPDSLKIAFRQHVTRKLRRSDITITIEGHRFEVPSAYRHLDRMTVGFARWDLSFVHLIDEKTGKCLARLWPVDRSRNASGERRLLEDKHAPTNSSEDGGEYPPFLRELLEDHAQSGVVPGYIVKDEEEKEL